MKKIRFHNRSKNHLLLRHTQDTPPPPSDTKPADTTPPVDPKPTESKPADTPPAQTKSADTPPAESKPADTPPAQSKPVESKPADTPASSSPPSSDSPAASSPAASPASTGSSTDAPALPAAGGGGESGSSPVTAKAPLNIPWVPILGAIGGLILLIFLIWLIRTIWKRIKTTYQYNQTPQHFVQKPDLTWNQKRNLLSNQMTNFKKYKQDLRVQKIKQFGGSVYQVTFTNQKHPKFSAAYWTKQMKTDCYYQVQIDTLDSQIQIGFANTDLHGQFNDGIQTKLGRAGVSISSSGNLQAFGQLKYKFKWNLQYGDVIGIGISNVDTSRRVWITKNGVLQNPPTSDQIQKWVSKQLLSAQNPDLYNSIAPNKLRPGTPKQDLEYAKRKVSLPTSQSFSYYAIVGCWQITGGISSGMSKQNMKKYRNQGYELRTTIKVNVGGKMFKLRQPNFTSGLLADSLQKMGCCSWFPCCC